MKFYDKLDNIVYSENLEQLQNIEGQILKLLNCSKKIHMAWKCER